MEHLDVRHEKAGHPVIVGQDFAREILMIREIIDTKVGRRLKMEPGENCRTY